MKALSIEDKIFFPGNGDLHTEFGMIRKTELDSAKEGDTIKTNTGREMRVFFAGFIDRYRKMKRMAQVIPMKDIGQIIIETGLNRESKVVEAGSGSGGLCLALANIVKKVYTYEIREDFFLVVKKNIETLGLKNIVQKMKDIYLGIDEMDVDVIVLDLPEPWKAVEGCKAALKTGGWLASYSPSIIQASDFREKIREAGFLHVKTIEIIERIWEVEGRKVRPKIQPITHSGFICFARKL